MFALLSYQFGKKIKLFIAKYVKDKIYIYNAIDITNK